MPVRINSVGIHTRLNAEFSLFTDYISLLGARKQPYAVLWNLTGFLVVGILLSLFGWNYGCVIKDKTTGTLFTFFGLGFAATAIPVDIENSFSGMSKAHTVAICLSLASWLFGLARMAGLSTLEPSVRSTPNTTAILFIFPVIGSGLGLYPEPVTHRLVFTIIFGWISFTSVRILRKNSIEKYS